MPTSVDTASGAGLWRAATGSKTLSGKIDAAALRPAAQRLAELTSPVAADWLAAPLAEHTPALIAPAEVERARQLNRFRRIAARNWLALIADAGIPVVAMKGFATAHRFYPDPFIRSMGDIDLLVHEADLGRLIACLGNEGFGFYRSVGTPPWGLVSEASYHPFVSADGVFSFDLHIQPDDYPVFRSLDVDAVFDAAQMVDVEGLRVTVPSDDHLVVLAITNAARDKFDPASVRSITDVIAALVHAGHRCDWDMLEQYARMGGWGRRLRVAVALLARLGVPAACLPVGTDQDWSGVRARALQGIVTDYMTLFAREPSRLHLQWRDWVLISSAGVLIRRNLRRLRGLVRPWPGLPEGARLSD